MAQFLMRAGCRRVNPRRWRAASQALRRAAAHAIPEAHGALSTTEFLAAIEQCGPQCAAA
jgi:hypothetical protein